MSDLAANVRIPTSGLIQRAGLTASESKMRRKDDEDLRYVRHRLNALERVVDDHGDVLVEHGETLKDHETRLSEVESVLRDVINRLDELNDYKKMSLEQLHEVQGELRFMLKIVASIVDNAVNVAGRDAAKALQLRIKKNAGYLNSALQAKTHSAAS